MLINSHQCIGSLLRNFASHIKRAGIDNYRFKITVGLLRELVEKSWQVFLFSEGNTPGDQFGIYADTSRSQKILKMKSWTPLDEGLSRFVEWARRRLESATRLSPH